MKFKNGTNIIKKLFNPINQTLFYLVKFIYLKQSLYFIFLVLFFLNGCFGQKRLNNLANEIAEESKLRPVLIKTSKFKLKGYYRFTDPNKTLNVYIEGDGQAYLHRNMPSNNPTPRNPIALRLAGLDFGANVLYLARPCHYVNLNYERLCNTPYWTTKRFSKEVILSINEAIDKMVLRSKVEGIHLVGYSGGGAVAALVTASRNDVLSLRTLAGYMDHVSLNKNVGVSPLKGSLDPIKVAHKLKSIPQIHYSGKKDKVIPNWVAKNFAHAVRNNNCTFTRLTNATHTKGWEKVWRKVWSKIPACR